LSFLSNQSFLRQTDQAGGPGPRSLKSKNGENSFLSSSDRRAKIVGKSLGSIGGGFMPCVVSWPQARFLIPATCPCPPAPGNRNRIPTPATHAKARTRPAQQEHQDTIITPDPTSLSCNRGLPLSRSLLARARFRERRRRLATVSWRASPAFRETGVPSAAAARRRRRSRITGGSTTGGASTTNTC